MTIDTNGRSHAPDGVSTGGQFETTRTPEPAASLVRAAAASPEAGNHGIDDPNSFADVITATGNKFWEDLANNDKTPLPLLAALSHSESASIRATVAGNFSIDDEIRDRLSRDEDGEVRAGTIYGSDPTAEFLARFDGDDDYDVNYALARARNINPNQLRRVATVEGVPLHDVIENPNCPQDLRDELFASGTSMTQETLVSSRYVTPAQLDVAVVSEHEYVRTSLARRDDISADHQKALSADPDVGVRIALAYNSKASDKTLGALTADEDREVRRVAGQTVTWKREGLPW